MKWTSLGLLLCLSVTGWSPKAASAFVTKKHATHPQRSTISPTSIRSSGVVHRELFSSSNNNDMNDDEGGSYSSRRQVLRQATAVAGSTLASWWLWGSEPGTAAAAAADTTKKRICVTGCTSGIGLDAATRLAAQGHELLLAGRTTSKAQAAAARILETVPNANIGLAFECNLASLSSIQKFASQIQQLSSSSSSSSQPFAIDVLCLNAGLSRDAAAKDIVRTTDGFELTVGTNHLGHFYLNQLLLPMMNKNTGRIVVTASGVHDPESPGGNQGETATLGDLKGLEQRNFEMVDGGPFSADKAYKDSKLCNVLFTRELQRRLTASGSGITTSCFSPGLILESGFFRNQNPLFVKAFTVGVKVAEVGETSHWGGGALEYVATSPQVANQGGTYFLAPPGSSKYGDAAYGREFKVAQVSKEAQDDSKAKRLWELSETLVAGSTA
eukprot:CAMPEP_0198282228 /NCGR_PEP_ID=MMETSP1449-20131203/2072_1 /TAXON_ID=420275 /ORGANISM="Attheya septentrionalis, Strain CCMP2084" /LENGTH=441 /DNA_ID=CAMNT_0043978393 /DNA_START=140 /DNA_END=1465 /DNA_ORIENTATION=+